MPRIARIAVPGLCYHVTQRGNNRQKVFSSPADYQTYLALLRKQAQTHGLSLLGFCLMPNHIHLLAVPEKNDSLARTVGRTNWQYTQIINQRHRRSGHLWQNRFYSCALEGAHLLAALAYVERNPVRSGAVKRAEDYRWSSARAHLCGRDPLDLLDLKTWSRVTVGVEWGRLLHRGEEDEDVDRIRRQTRLGRPLGGESFVSELERTLGRPLRVLAVGRPKKQKPEKSRRRVAAESR